MAAGTSLGRCSLADRDLLSAIGDLGFAAEDLASLHEPSLIVLSSVDKIRVVESKLNSTVHNVISSLNAKHERVILVTNLEKSIMLSRQWK
jgi:hypothetical protein